MTMLKLFSVEGLFGTTQLRLPFKSKALIVIGENGLGKTQILNMLYYSLTLKFERLLEYNFDSLTLEFDNQQGVTIYRDEIENVYYKNPVVADVVKRIGLPKLVEIQNNMLISNHSIYEKRNVYLRRMIEDLPISTGMLMEALEVLGSGGKRQSDLFGPTFAEYKFTLEKLLDGNQILYFPTYRRVEEDLRNLGYDEEKFEIDREDTRLINFGMDDVQKRFINTTKQIERLSKEGLSKISSEILSQLVKGLPPIDNEFLKTIDQKDIEIILARVGNQITEEDKLKIKSIVETKEIQDKDHSLLYFLQKLINIYDQQRDLDNSIKVFRDICNKYLTNKELVYDESSIEIYLCRKSPINDESRIPLSKLSSGEKQIISIFSKIYLAPSGSAFIVLFDEPELSLSLFWQRQLLPDIFRSEKCKFLLAVTHSPFIFENDLDEFAIDLNQYLHPQYLKLN